MIFKFLELLGTFLAAFVPQNYCLSLPLPSLPCISLMNNPPPPMTLPASNHSTQFSNPESKKTQPTKAQHF